MAKIKVYLEKNETPEEADDLLYKALEHHRSGEQHTEGFTDPAMQDLAQKLEGKYADLYQQMLREIEEELDKEYDNGIF